MTDVSGEPIDGTQEVSSSGEDSPSWGYEEKKRRFSKEILIAFLAITVLLSLGGFLIWKGFNKPSAMPPDTLIAGQNPTPPTTPDSDNTSPYINPTNSLPSTTQDPDPSESVAANQLPEDPFKDQPVASTTPPPRGVFDTLPSEPKAFDPLPSTDTSVASTTEPARPATMPDFGGASALPQNNEPASTPIDPVFAVDTEMAEPIEPKPARQIARNERSRPETTFVDRQPEPTSTEFQPPRSSAVEPMPQREPAMLDPMPTNTGAYIVKEGDNYWEISKKVYGIHGLFLALYEFNRTRYPDANLLKPGTSLETPDVSTLRALAGSLDSTRPPKPEPRRGNVESSVASTTVRRPTTNSERETGLFFDEEGLPYFRVGKNDTLRKIASEHLGRSERSKQIYKMNQDLLKNENDLRVGAELRLPRDASRAVLATSSVSDRY